MHTFLLPGQLFMIVLFALLFLMVIKNDMSLEGLIAAMNTLGSQPMALLVLIVGCVMVKICKDVGVDSNLAAGIIGCALGLLNNQFAKQHTESTSDDGKKTVTTDVTNTPPKPNGD